MSNELTKIYEFATRLIEVLEEEIESLKPNNKKVLPKKNNVISAFSKLVNIILQLKKFDKEQIIEQPSILQESDLEIIQDFLKKYQKKFLSK